MAIQGIEYAEEFLAGHGGGALDDAVGREGLQSVGFVVVEVLWGKEGRGSVGAHEVGYFGGGGEEVALGEADGAAADDEDFGSGHCREGCVICCFGFWWGLDGMGYIAVLIDGYSL